MNTMKKALIAGATTLAIAIPLATFAANNGYGGYFGFRVHSGSGQTFTLPTQVQEALTASGIAIPTAEEMQAHRDEMQKVAEAMQNLSDADRTELQNMREAGQKAERDYLRSKWVPFPSEEEIAKFETFQQEMRNVMHSQYSGDSGFGPGNGRGFGRHEGGFGGGFGGGMGGMMRGW